VQELESKFKDAYSQSLSNKDERIQVLERRVEEMIRDNTQLREDLTNLRKTNDKLKESPQGSPAMAAAKGKEQGSPADSVRLRERVSAVQDKVNQGVVVLGRDGIIVKWLELTEVIQVF